MLLVVMLACMCSCAIQRHSVPFSTHHSQSSFPVPTAVLPAGPAVAGDRVLLLAAQGRLGGAQGGGGGQLGQARPLCRLACRSCVRKRRAQRGWQLLGGSNALPAGRQQEIARRVSSRTHVPCPRPSRSVHTPIFPPGVSGHPLLDRRAREGAAAQPVHRGHQLLAGREQAQPGGGAQGLPQRQVPGAHQHQMRGGGCGS